MSNCNIYSDIEYKRAFKELLVILNYIPKTDYEKVPYDIIQTLKNNADYSYKFSLDTKKDINEQNISELTKAMIENFYRDYWITDAEREKVIQKENIERQDIENKKREKYNSNNIFKNKNIEQRPIEGKTALIEYKDNNLLQKLFDKIKDLLKRK